MYCDILVKVKKFFYIFRLRPLRFLENKLLFSKSRNGAAT